jgi:hypothetical protein
VLVRQELDDGADGVAFAQLLPVVIVVLAKDTQDLEGLEPNPSVTAIEHVRRGGDDDAMFAHEVLLGSSPLAHVRDEDASMQCAVFRLLLLERIIGFFSTSFCIVADDGVAPGGDARPAVVMVACRQVGQGRVVGDEEHSAHGARQVTSIKITKRMHRSLKYSYIFILLSNILS